MVCFHFRNVLRGIFTVGIVCGYECGDSEGPICCSCACIEAPRFGPHLGRMCDMTYLALYFLQHACG